MSEKCSIVICKQKRTDCNRYQDGLCGLLTDSNFKKPCPFYKKKEVEKK